MVDVVRQLQLQSRAVKAVKVLYLIKYNFKKGPFPASFSLFSSFQ